MKKVLILGSTGSIGKSTIEVIEANKKDFLIEHKSNKPTKIQRKAVSIFNERESSLVIEFSFNEINKDQTYLGAEKHIIYPIDIERFANELSGLYKRISITQFPNQCKTEKANNYSMFRNWLLVIEI